mgnify:CR=1 FL=1
MSSHQFRTALWLRLGIDDVIYPTEAAAAVVREYREKKTELTQVINAMPNHTDADVAPQPHTKKLQHYYYSYLSRRDTQAFTDKISNSGELHDKARILSAEGSFAGAWLHNVPTKQELQMSSHQFRTALWLRLGIEFASRPNRCSCKEAPVITKHLDHLLYCPLFNGVKKRRHDNLVREIKSLCQHAGLNFIDPRLGELRTPLNDDNKATDGHIQGLYQRSLYIDVTVCNPTCKYYLDKGSAMQQHCAIDIREDAKEKMYKNRCLPFQGDFMAIAFETYGACSKKFDDFLKTVTNLAAQKNHVEPGVLLNYWRKRISTCLQVGNANIISDAFIYLFDQGGGNLTIDYSVESTL